MERKQYSLCAELLALLQSLGVLDHIIVVGSWCLPVYRTYFAPQALDTVLRTRDIDLLIPVPLRFRGKVDLPEALKRLGFLTDFRGRNGYMRFLHPDLILEFLVPERGPAKDKPEKDRCHSNSLGKPVSHPAIE